MKTYAAQTFGCSMNYSDTERVATVLESLGLFEIEDTKNADVVIFNTCSIKQKAEDKVFSLIHNIHKKRKKEKKEVKILVTGCMVKQTSSQADEEKDPLLKRIPEIDAVFRIEDTLLLPQILKISENSFEQKEEAGESKRYLSIIPKYKNKVQAIVPIQTGCDNFCTFCVVPFTRGREKSRSIEHIMKEVTALAKRGVKEIWLVGQNVNSYGKGLPETKRQFDEENAKWFESSEKTPFTLLLEQVNAVEGIERIQFQSSNPHDMTDDIIDAICTLPKVMPNLHFALQSADNEVLKKMNRRHTWEQYKNIVEKIRSKRPDFAITTDIIVGFTDESDEAFERTIQAMEEIDIDLIYLSQYSLRPGTAASKVLPDNVPQEVKKARWHKLNDWLKKHVHKKLHSLIGSTQKVLIEKIIDGVGEGKTEHNRSCQVFGNNFQEGDIVQVKITGNSQWTLQADII